MNFDQFTVVLLRRNPDGPQLSEADAAALQDAHLAHLAGLHEAGQLLAAGPLAFDDPGEPLCGLSILPLPVEEARALKEADPAVRAGVFTLQVLPWQVPAGAVTYSATRFPHSVAEVLGD
jgi:uncharacterized protein